MAEQPNEIERDIERSRDRLRENLQALESKVKESTDWRTYLDRYPLAALGIAFGGGLLLARVVPISEIANGSSQRPSKPTSFAAGSEQKSYESRKSSNGTPSQLQKIGGALVTIAMQRFNETLDELVPGFSTLR